MFKYDFGELGVRPMRVNHKLSPSQGWNGEPCLVCVCIHIELYKMAHLTLIVPVPRWHLFLSRLAWSRFQLYQILRGNFLRALYQVQLLYVRMHIGDTKLF